MKKFFTHIKFMLCVAEYAFAAICSLFVCRKAEYKDLWIIAERGHDARDNGYWFFKYLRENHPEINAMYVIDRNSADRPKVAKLGKTIDYGSFKHYICVVLSKVKVSTHIMGYTPHMYWFDKLNNLNLVGGKRISIRHGISGNDPKELHYPKCKIDMLACSATPEYKHILDNYNQPEGVVRLTGCCRYDNLKSECKVKKQVLLMPTWRKTMIHYTGTDEFTNSEYYKQFNMLINNRQIIDMLEKYDYTMVFYPHFEVQKYLNTFKSCSERVIMAGFDKYDVQQLLQESAVLITDYSSVMFDFAYLKKPAIYFQFDADEFFKKQYSRGYFDYERDGFGIVCTSLEKVAKQLETCFENDMNIEKKYLDRINGFFEFDDTKNCERNYKAICSLLEK